MPPASSTTTAAPPPERVGERASIAERLIELSRLIEGIRGYVAEHHGLTSVQAKLLCVLAVGPRGMADLARTFGVEKAALTGLVDRAERRGLVERRPVPGDRRAVQVALTEKGRRAASSFHADATAVLDELVEPFSPIDRERFGRALGDVLAAAVARRGDAQCVINPTSVTDR